MILLMICYLGFVFEEILYGSWLEDTMTLKRVALMYDNYQYTRIHNICLTDAAVTGPCIPITIP